MNPCAFATAESHTPVCARAIKLCERVRNERAYVHYLRTAGNRTPAAYRCIMEKTE